MALYFLISLSLTILPPLTSHPAQLWSLGGEKKKIKSQQWLLSLTHSSANPPPQRKCTCWFAYAISCILHFYSAFLINHLSQRNSSGNRIGWRLSTKSQPSMLKWCHFCEGGSISWSYHSTFPSAAPWRWALTERSGAVPGSWGSLPALGGLIPHFLNSFYCCDSDSFLFSSPGFETL